ncbi:MAG: hypothetical protein JST80_05145 [Bdellovibrionales bacterium]|nr:hypothetical protein [Bdellovibrionales bacterium]
MDNQNLSQGAATGQPVYRKSSFKYYFLMMLLGISVVTTLVSIYMPRMITWYFDPPMPMGVSCSSSIDWAIQRLQWAQAGAVGVGAILGLIIAFRFRSKPPRLN